MYKTLEFIWDKSLFSTFLRLKAKADTAFLKLLLNQKVQSKEYMDGPREYYVWWKSQTKTNTVWHHLYMESKKIQQTSEYDKKEADSQI